MDPTPEHESFGARLQRLREACGFKNQGEFAKRIGIKQPSLSALESGDTKEPMGSTLLAAAAVLGLSPRYLLTGEGDPETGIDVIEGQLFDAFSGVAPRLLASRIPSMIHRFRDRAARCRATSPSGNQSVWPSKFPFLEATAYLKF